MIKYFSFLTGIMIFVVTNKVYVKVISCLVNDTCLRLPIYEDVSFNGDKRSHL